MVARVAAVPFSNFPGLKYLGDFLMGATFFFAVLGFAISGIHA